MDAYEAVLHAVAENPGVTIDGITDTDRVDTVSNPVELLQQAVVNGDVICVNSQYWIVRKGKFAFHEYDHPET